MKSTTITAIVIIAIIVIAAVFLIPSLSAQKVANVKTEENIGKTVSVKGEVKNVIKIGELSAYTLEDETGTIGVSTEDLPQEGDTVTARGTLIRDTIFGYYIKVN
jgi:uncharacterized protein YdeI (BOF family)